MGQLFDQSVRVDCKEGTAEWVKSTYYSALEIHWFCRRIRATIENSCSLRQEPLNLCPRKRQSEFGGGRPDTRNRSMTVIAGMVFRLRVVGPLHAADQPGETPILAEAL
jgi:hypothetical protein